MFVEVYRKVGMNLQSFSEFAARNLGQLGNGRWGKFEVKGKGGKMLMEK